MGLLPREASFSEEVADFFLTLCGRGLALSPLDAELLVKWQALGIPAEVAFRGIRLGWERALRDAAPGAPPVRSLRQLRRTVEKELAQWRQLHVGQHAEAVELPAEELRPLRAIAWLQTLEGFDAASPLGRAASTLRRVARAPADRLAEAAWLFRAELLLAALWERALPTLQRAEMRRTLVERMGEVRGRSLKARKAALRVHRVRVAREHGLPSPPLA